LLNFFEAVNPNMPANTNNNVEGAGIATGLSRLNNAGAIAGSETVVR
jgi:hypothetical protein